MKRILIGVLFVVGIAAIGLGVTALVYGRFGVQKDVTSKDVTSTVINPYPIATPTFSLEMNGLESRTVSNTAAMRSSQVMMDFYTSTFRRCYYEDLKFVSGISTVHIAQRSMILKVDDSFTTNADVSEDKRVSMMLFKYHDEYYLVKHSGGGWAPSPVEPGDYRLQFSSIGANDISIDSDKEGMHIVSAEVVPVDGNFVIMICETR